MLGHVFSGLTRRRWPTRGRLTRFPGIQSPGRWQCRASGTRRRAQNASWPASPRIARAAAPSLHRAGPGPRVGRLQPQGLIPAVRSWRECNHSRENAPIQSCTGRNRFLKCERQRACLGPKTVPHVRSRGRTLVLETAGIRRWVLRKIMGQSCPWKHLLVCRLEMAPILCLQWFADVSNRSSVD